MRKLLTVLLAAAALAASAPVALAPAAGAAAAQITDPALDYPLPWGDLVSVELHVVSQRGHDYIQTTFTVSGTIDDVSRNAMTGYDFVGQIGDCELHVTWYAYPFVTQGLPPLNLPQGSAGSSCGATGKDLGGSFKFSGSSVAVLSPLIGMKNVHRGSAMSKLSARTVPVEGFDGDDTGALALLGDAASTDKTFTLH